MKTRFAFSTTLIGILALAVSIVAFAPLASAGSANGTWTANEAPFAPVSGSATVSLPSLSCPTANFCIAVGSVTGSISGVEPLMEEWNGVAWDATSTAVPVPSNAASGNEENASLSAVSCSSASFCVAVGTYIDTSGGQSGFIDTLFGGTWTAAEAAQPADGGTDSNDLQLSSLDTVTCWADGACITGGFYNSDIFGVPQYGLLDTLSGGTWTATSVPDNGGEINSLSCSPDAETCVAVGSWFNSSANYGEALIDTYSAGSWTVIDSPLAPSNATAYDYTLSDLSSVACSSDSSCVAAGQYGVGSGYAGLIETLTSGSWTSTEAPAPSNAGSPANANLVSVACSAVGSCEAAGTYSEMLGAEQGLIESLSGGEWSAFDAPTPAPESSGATLQDVECSLAGSCIAVGQFEDSDGNVNPLADLLSGGTWIGVEAPTPPNAGSPANAALGAIACPSADTCVAVGTYQDSLGNTVGMLDSYEYAAPTAAPVPSTPPPTTGGSNPLTSLRISSLTPWVGYAGVKVVIQGSGFTPDSAVYFGDRAASSFEYGSPLELVATVPPGHAGRVVVTVRNGGSIGTYERALDFTYLPGVATVEAGTGRIDSNASGVTFSCERYSSCHFLARLTEGGRVVASRRHVNIRRGHKARIRLFPVAGTGFPRAEMGAIRRSGVVHIRDTEL